MRIFFALLAFVIAAPSVFAQNVNPARIYEQSRGTEPPVQGVWHVYDRQGNLLREENYENYRLDGEMKIFYPSGALKELLHYSDGLRVGDDKAYFENGGLEHEYNYVDNDLEGPAVHYYDTGEVKSRENYSNGKLEGRKSIYFKNGILKQSLNYENGLLEDAATTYSPDGTVIVEEHYSRGHLISHNEFGNHPEFVSKSTDAKGAVAPTSDTEPITPDTPTKL